MNLIKCLVVDDEKLAQEVLVSHIARHDLLQLKGVCNNVLELISLLHKDPDVDLIFLDIRMPEISGLDFVKIFNRPPAVIYTTAYSQHALEAFDQQAIDYLLKPVSLERFSKAVSRARQLLRPEVQQEGAGSTVPQVFYVKSDKKLVKIDPAQLLYAEGLRNYISLVTIQGEKTIVHSTLTAMEERFAGAPDMCRVHKSFLVNLLQVKYLENHVLTLTGGQEIPIGLHYREAVLGRLNIS